VYATRELLRDPIPGSISSLRCQKSRTRIPKGCKVRSDVFADDLNRTSFSKVSYSVFEPSGGARRDRTDDLMLAKHALSQLSYGPVLMNECPRCARLHPSGFAGHARFVSHGCATRSRRRSVVGLGRLELPTSRLSSARSNQLSYKPLTTNFLEKDSGHARAHRLDARRSHMRSPWRVFVREERETKTAKSRQWSSTDLAICWPLMFQKRLDRNRSF
jgi:hypothetical protein